MKNAGYRDEDDESGPRSKPPRTKNGCIDWDDMVEEGENSNGQTSVTVNGLQRGDDYKGPQDWAWGDTRDGDRFGPFRPEPDDGFGLVGIAVPAKRKKR